LPLPRFTLALIACSIAACGTGPQRPAPPAFDDDARFSVDMQAAQPTAAPAGPWWRQAVAQARWSTMEQVLPGNPRLREADAAVDAARARLEQATADSGPLITVGADLDARRTSDDSSDSRSAGIDARLPIDLRGSLAARRDAGAQLLRAVEAERDQLHDDLARDYLLALLDGSEGVQRIRLLEEQLELANTLLRLIELRFTQGLASSVDVLQQRDQVAALRQQLPLTGLEVVSAGNRLRFAAGVTPERALPQDPGALLEVATGYPALVPTDLLQRRGSLRAAAARLQAADAEFAAALADRLPEIGLSAGLLARIVSSDYTRIISATLDAAFTLFDGGRKQAVASERRAQLAAAGERYLDAWLSLVIDLDTWLHEERSLLERIELADGRLANAQTLLTAAQRRYERGVSDYLPVLEALRGLQQQQRDLLALRAELARVRIRIHHGFGQPAAGDVS
jgi:outer membrane protein TolC